MPSAVIVGAGIFGGSLAHELVERGWEVTLVDQYPPGHVRAASGGESRLIRAAHGSDVWYVRSARRAWQRWRQLEEESGTSLLVPCGAVWLARDEAGWEAESERVLRSEGIPVERLAPQDAASLFPSFAGDDLAFCLLEPEAGVLRARDATRAIVSLARSKGVRFVGGVARPAAGGAIDVEGETLAADVCRLGLRRVAREDLSGRGSPAGDAPGGAALRRPDRLGDAARAGVGRLRRCVLRGRRPRRARRQGLPRSRGPGVRPRPRQPRSLAAGRVRCPRLPGPPVPRARRRAARVLTRLPLRAHAATRTSWSRAIPKSRAYGCSGAARDTASSTARRSRSTSPALIERGEEPDERFGLGERRPGASLRTAGTPSA